MAKLTAEQHGINAAMKHVAQKKAAKEKADAELNAAEEWLRQLQMPKQAGGNVEQ